MNKSTLRNLAVVLFALIAIMIGFELGDRDESVDRGSALYPDFRERINDVATIIVEFPGGDVTTISRVSGTWSVVNRDTYAASIGKVREILLAIGDAEILEEKTADPNKYAALGVNEPSAADSRGVRVTASGDDFSYELIVGDSHQGSNRYVRPVDSSVSLLIDQAISLPETAAGWLRTDLVDIEGPGVELVSIRHADGETIGLYKTDQSETGFQIEDIPEGRELSYPTVANGIGSALSDLSLEDVRRAKPGGPDVVADYEMFNGLRLSLQVFAENRTDAESDGDENDVRWIAISASVVTDDSLAADKSAADDETADPVAEAEAINDRLGGWQFQVAEFKGNQLTRRWVDILKADDN